MSTQSHTDLSMIERLRLAISNTGLSMAAVARACDIPYRTLQNYLLESRVPPGDALQKICITLKINANWLFSGVGNTFLMEPGNLHNDKINQRLLEIIIEEFEVCDIVKTVYYSPKEKSIAISLIYAEFSELIDESPADAAEIIHDKKKFSGAVHIFLIKQMVRMINVMGGRLGSDEELHLVPLEFIPEHLRPKIDPEEAAIIEDIHEFVREVDKKIIERNEAEARGEYKSPFEPQATEMEDANLPANQLGGGKPMRVKKGRTSGKGRT